MTNKLTPPGQGGQNGHIAFYIAMFLLGIVLLCIYKLNRDTAAEPDLLIYLCKEAGMALLVAVCLIFSIERISRREHQAAADRLINDIGTGIFKAIYQRYIPEPVFAEVEKCLMYSQLYRTGYKLVYTLRELTPAETATVTGAAGNDYIVCEIFSGYTIENTCDHEITAQLLFTVEIPNEAQLRALTAITAFSVGGDDKITPAQPIRQNQAKPDADLEFPCQVTLSAGQKVDIRMRGCTAKRRIDSELWSSRIPSAGVDVTVNFPLGWSVESKALHSEKLCLESESSTSKCWSLKHGIFPFQSVVMWWNHKP